MSKKIRLKAQKIVSNRTKNFNIQMDINSKNGMLTPRQHEALRKLALLRHELHTNTYELWNLSSPRHEELMAVYDADTFNGMLQNAGMPVLFYLQNTPDALVTNEVYFKDFSDGERDVWIRKAATRGHKTGYEAWFFSSEGYEQFYRSVEKWSWIVERYLKDVDRVYGTQYAPSGLARELRFRKQDYRRSLNGEKRKCAGDKEESYFNRKEMRRARYEASLMSKHEEGVFWTDAILNEERRQVKKYL